MSKIYHLNSAQEVSADILESIKATFKSKPITIIVEEDTGNYELTEEMKAVLDQRLEEDQTAYITSEESIGQLNKKYGI